MLAKSTLTSRPWGGFLTIAVVFCLTGWLSAQGTLDGLEDWVLRSLFSLRGPRPPRAPVAVVAIDEGSLKRFGQMPWSRFVFARILQQLTKDGAAAVGFDVAFEELGRQPGEDQALADALRKLGRTVLPVYRPLESGPVVGPSLLKPIPALSKEAIGFGLVQFLPEPTAAVLWVEPVQAIGSSLVPTLGMAVAEAYRYAGMARSDSNLLSSSRMALDYTGPAGSIPTVPAWEVLAGKAKAGYCRGKAILIGATAAGLPDTGFIGGFGGPMPGVELHATVVENLLARRGLRKLPPWASIVTWILVAVIPGSLLARARGLAPARRLATFGLSLAAVVGLGWEGFLLGWWLPTAALSLLVVLTGLGGLLRIEGLLLAERAQLLSWYANELASEARRQRERVDGELHDEAQQLVIAVGRELRALQKTFHNERIEPIAELNQRVLDEILRVRKDLVPRVLEQEGLVSAIREMALDLSQRGQAQFTVRVTDWPTIDEPMAEEVLYWLIKEATNNAFKHANAHLVQIAFEGDGKQLRIRVTDDGAGMKPSPSHRKDAQGTEHSGLRRMAARAQALGGSLQIDSAEGKGTTVAFELPRALGQRLARIAPRKPQTSPQAASKEL